MAETETRSRHLKPWPKFRSDAEADEWLQKADLTQYDLETANVPFKAWWAAMVPGDDPRKVRHKSHAREGGQSEDRASEAARGKSRQGGVP